MFNSRDILATVLLTGFYLDGDSASPYPRFPDRLKKTEMAFYLRREISKLYVFHLVMKLEIIFLKKILKKCCIRPSQNLDI